MTTDEKLLLIVEALLELTHSDLRSHQAIRRLQYLHKALQESALREEELAKTLAPLISGENQ